MRLIESYASDCIHRVSNGEVLIAKHFLLALGLHSITGQEKPVQIANRLGHNMIYVMIKSWILKLHERKSRRSFWILLNYLSFPSNQQPKKTVY